MKLDSQRSHWVVSRESRGFSRRPEPAATIDVAPEAWLSDIFRHGNCCQLDAFTFQTKVTPPRTVGSREAFATFDGAEEKSLYLRLDDATYGFSQRARLVRQVRGALAPKIVAALTPINPPIMVSIHIIKTRVEKILLLVDERRDLPVAVISDAIYWNVEGLDVQYVT